PLAIGLTLMVMVYMGGHVSGAHYNPAVTVGIFMRGKIGASEIGPYIAAQIAGALVASGAVHFLTGEAFAPAPGGGAGVVEVLLAEIIFTFALMLVVLNVATSKATEGNSYYGLAIGFTVTAGAFAVGPISGGAFNPAVGTGPILANVAMGTGDISNLWYYWVGPLAGAVLATSVFKMQNPEG
ncbi:MAG TPA: aquaporin, partial [Acidobacteriota bacterium]|nr:aquaporin [Acidobacteriota bacterium]